MPKRNRFFYFIVPICLLFACFLHFSPLIFSEEMTEEEEPAFSLSPDYPDYNVAEGSTKEEPKIAERQIYGKEEPEQKSSENHPAEEQTENPPVSPLKDPETQSTWDDALLDKISFLQCPLPGAGVTCRDSQLPGAPRAYRNGIHEGLDFYSGACGIDINFGDPVFAAGPGVVYRIDHDYQELPTEEREKQLKICAATNDTPEDILDMLRGRQVWLVHSNEIITRYAHLCEVSSELQVGNQVEAGSFIGNIGNSGTSDGAAGTTSGAHLHFEIWIGDDFLAKGLSPHETRKLWEQVLEK
ncbi:MAG: M23 family metallopeptidase [Firmicutes bacterium]|nr:M23 family metallopeptidase [Bacillota bacterium]